MPDDTDSQQRDLRNRIASFMQADGQVRRKVSQAEAQTLSAASTRLDRLLKGFDEDEDVRRKEAREKEFQSLRAAVGRLDRMLAGVTGKGSMPKLKLRRRVSDEPGSDEPTP
jgi:hypothetical protein